MTIRSMTGHVMTNTAIPDLGEHIEEMLKLFMENGQRFTNVDVADEVLGIAYAQGLVTHEQSLDPEVIRIVADQVDYIRG